MAQIYNNFRVIDYDEAEGAVELGWYDDQLPLGGQKILRRNHKIPLEAEQASWTRAQYLTYFLSQVEDIADVPQWAKDEAHATRLTYVATPEVI
jgi:hypothetical protein